MKIFVLKETNSDARVSASPETTKKLVELGLDVNVQNEAGLGSNFSNDSLDLNELNSVQVTGKNIITKPKNK